MIQLKGNWVEVDPGSWKKRNKFKICVAFGAGNKDAMLSRLALLAAKQLEALAGKIPVVTPENLYNTYVEMTKAADITAPEQYWTDPQKIPPPPNLPPPEVQKAILDGETQKSITAAKIMQQDVESQRKAVTDKYAIDSNVGVQLLRDSLAHEQEQNMQTIKSHHDAEIGAVGRQFKSATDGMMAIPTTLARTHAAIEEHGQKLGAVAEKIGDIFENVNKAVKIATGRRVIRKGKDGTIDGVDILDEEGKVLASHKAVKGPDGRVTGLQ